MNRILAAATCVLSLGCGTEGIDPVPQMTAELRNQCVRLKIPMNLVKTGEPTLSGDSELFLSPHEYSDEAVSGQLSAGTEFVITEVVHRRSFEGASLRIHGTVKGGNDPALLSISTLFGIDWRADVSRQLNYEQAVNSGSARSALDETLAEWCGEEESPQT